MPHYTFTSTWEFEAELEQVWDCIRDVASWPEWWRGVKKTEVIRQMDEEVYYTEWSALIPYVLGFYTRIEAIDPGRSVSLTAWGDLEGEGRWTFDSRPGWCRITFHWEVRATKWWMEAGDLVGRPAFVLNHDALMLWGAEGLSKKLGVRLVQHNALRRDMLGSFVAEAAFHTPMRIFREGQRLFWGGNKK